MIDLGYDEAQRQDEDKVFIGFPDQAWALEAFHSLYPPFFMGGMLAMPVQQLIEKLAFHKSLTHNERPLALDAKPIPSPAIDSRAARFHRLLDRVLDSEFEETKHPRVKGGSSAGQFGKGSG
jgi:hypothetical protein